MQKLHSNCRLWLSDQDKNTLINDGYLDNENIDTPGPVEVDVANMLRVSTMYVSLNQWNVSK